MAGHLTQKYSPENRSRFLSAQQPSDITALMQDFTSAVEKNEYEGQWPGAAYAVSKCGLIGLTRCLATEQQARDGSVLINACCPGYVKTDMTKGGGMKTPDQGAMTPVLLALGKLDMDKTGGFWQHEKEIQW